MVVYIVNGTSLHMLEMKEESFDCGQQRCSFFELKVAG